MRCSWTQDGETHTRPPPGRAAPVQTTFLGLGDGAHRASCPFRPQEPSPVEQGPFPVGGRLPVPTKQGPRVGKGSSIPGGAVWGFSQAPLGALSLKPLHPPPSPSLEFILSFIPPPGLDLGLNK